MALQIMKKIFSFLTSSTSKESSLMERATEIALGQTTFSHRAGESHSVFDDSNYNHDFDDFQNELHQQNQHLHDPYINPGQDIVVDEVYHGIDHSHHEY